MYQLEVKAALVQYLFNPASGWRVSVDVDPMELAKGGQHPAAKAGIAQRCRSQLETLGATIGADAEYGRADIVARHPDHGTYVVEVEGDTSRQREQAMYSALGQTLLIMTADPKGTRYALAVPDDPTWERQVSTIPHRVLELLQLDVFLVSEAGVRTANRSGA